MGEFGVANSQAIQPHVPTVWVHINVLGGNGGETGTELVVTQAMPRL